MLRAAIACDPLLVEAHVWLGIIMKDGALRETVSEFVEAIRIDERRRGWPSVLSRRDHEGPSDLKRMAGNALACA